MRIAVFPTIFSFLILLLWSRILPSAIAFKQPQPARIRIRSSSVSGANQFQNDENERDASSSIFFPRRKLILPAILLASSIALAPPSPVSAAGNSNAFLISDRGDNIVVSNSDEKTKTTTPGEYLIFSYIGLSGLAGVYGVATTAQKKKQQEK